MRAIKFWMTCLILLMPGVLLAAVEIKNPGDQGWLVITKEADAELQLKVRQAPLAKVLDSIASKTGVRMNYSVLPDELVSVNCVGTSVKQVLKCLLVGKADVVFRYAQALSSADGLRQIEEVWVIGAKSEAGQQRSLLHASAETQQPFSLTTEHTNAEPDQTDTLLKMASSNTPAERVEAIGRLLAGGRKGDAAVKQTLVAALSDPDAMVRVRALSSLAQREGAGAAAALREAMHDSHVSVRLTAVDNAGSDEALLQQALNDSDATVRQLAEIRLKRLEKTATAL
ncbi:MAG: HEAT repeat domain-containing protein [Methylobacter sp.]|nr:HEAT repeat domain-containing protein [Methylobacter sp.]